MKTSVTLFTSYANIIQEARGLLAEQIRDPEHESNPEYTRGIVELIATTFSTMEDLGEVARDIGFLEYDA